MSSIIPELTKKDFDASISTGFVLVDFYADWCMPCLMMNPVLEDLSEQMKDKLRFMKVNVDENKELSHRFQILSIPNMILFKDGKLHEQFIGEMYAEEFEERLLSLLK